jgi:hypothetical protein
MTCGIDCEHESQPSREHSAPLHSLIATHDHHHSSQPILQAGRHACGNHVESQPVVSPQRVSGTDEASILAEIPAGLPGRIPAAGARLAPHWQFGFPQARPQSISLRI